MTKKVKAKRELDVQASMWNLEEINTHLREYEIHRHKPHLLFEDVQLILTELGFLHSGGRQAMKKDPSINIYKERDLLDDLWMHMKGEYHANIPNLKIFIYGILGLKYSWMLSQDTDTSENHSCRSSTERITPGVRLLGNHYLEPSKPKAGNRNKQEGMKAEAGNKEIGSMNLANTSPMRVSVSKILKKTGHSNKNPPQAPISSKLGDSVGVFDSHGCFRFIQKVEIRKMNMHYKLLADNRASFVRQKKLNHKEKKIERIDKNKVDHKKYLQNTPPKAEIRNEIKVQQRDIQE